MLSLAIIIDKYEWRNARMQARLRLAGEQDSIFDQSKRPAVNPGLDEYKSENHISRNYTTAFSRRNSNRVLCFTRSFLLEPIVVFSIHLSH
jgi:hypothetical protein